MALSQSSCCEELAYDDLNYDNVTLDALRLQNDCDKKEKLLRSTDEEIKILLSEVEKLRLENEWCYNEKGERIILSPVHQTAGICQQIAHDPDLLKDVVIALRLKKIDLQSNITRLKEMCDSLEPKQQ